MRTYKRIFSAKVTSQKISQLSLQKLEKLNDELIKVIGGLAEAPPPPDPKPHPHTTLNPAP